MNKIPVLMYHSISDDDNKMSVGIKNFFSQMKLMIKLGYKSVRLNDLSNKNIDKKFVLTFDDGYEDVFVNALPILNKLEIKATCFFVSNQIGKYNIWDTNKSNFNKINLMDDNQINKWIDYGMEVGSHSTDHKNLKSIKYLEKINQIVKSKEFFKKKFNINVKSFSYPYGAFDNESVEIVKKNYDFAVTTNRSRYKENIFEKTQIPRIPINSDTNIFKFLLKITTFYEDIKFKE